MSNTKSVHEIRIGVFYLIEEMRAGDFKEHFGDDLDEEYSQALEHLLLAHHYLLDIEKTPIV